MLHPEHMSNNVGWGRVRPIPYYFTPGQNLNSSLNMHSLNYMWTTQGAKQVSLAAPTYIDLVMSSIQKLLDDENVFPTKSRTTF